MQLLAGPNPYQSPLRNRVRKYDAMARLRAEGGITWPGTCPPNGTSRHPTRHYDVAMASESTVAQVGPYAL